MDNMNKYQSFFKESLHGYLELRLRDHSIAIDIKLFEDIILKFIAAASESREQLLTVKKPVVVLINHLESLLHDILVAEVGLVDA